ncbi:hypothetical protein JGH11_18805 [Dysgonomonas sp. Marseille-P4677]|uniref:helix-turn-helix transcriptional regulator n=1 Tax=Dysgonomonas sp. Marseille-P4677 TaxID=2364790 RepID=UPI0019132F4E|nr:LuxR C-terminal-related transcriptional regulator [Dysgonomonas sp. Marseille-P4677]MBK5722923.1 hypothetical protein [Dysgonomonas sp. Marseille-P4677]
MVKNYYKIRLKEVFKELQNENVSKSEIPVLALNAIGFQADEIGDKMYISPNTARKHISNIKGKVDYHKDTELTGYFLCKLFDVNYTELRNAVQEFIKSELLKKLVTTVILSAVVLSLPHEHFEMTRNRRNSNNRSTIETRIEVRKEA